MAPQAPQAAERSDRLKSILLRDDSGIDQAIADYQTIYAASWKPPESFPDFVPALIRLAAELGRCDSAFIIWMGSRRRRSSGSCGTAVRHLQAGA